MSWIKNIAQRIPKGKVYWREILSIFFIGVGFYFFRKERGELEQVRTVLDQVHYLYILAGVALAVIYILLQSTMYVTSFSAVGAKITLKSAVELYLKRNLIGIFLPAGGVTSQTFFKSIVEKQGVSNTKTNLASYIFVFLGIASVLLVGIPVILILILAKGAVGKELYYFLGLVLLVVMISWISFSIYKKGWLYYKLIKISPQLELILQDTVAEKILPGRLLYTLLISVVVEFVGIAQLYVAMIAITSHVSLQAAFLGYTIATIFLIISPFLKGIGAIELSLVYILTLYGFDTAIAASVTFLYRFFNFWLLVLAGIVSFLFNRGNIVLRLFPTILIFFLGIINLVSGLSPAIHWRMLRLEQFLPIATIHASNDFVIVAGIILIITSAFLLRGLRSAWVIALVVSILSMIAHLLKAIDYEEATIAAITTVVLLITSSQYPLKSSIKRITVGVKVAFVVLITVTAFGVIGFYFLDKKQFGIDLNFGQSVKYTLQHFLLIDNGKLVPHTKFAKGFLRLINFMGIGALGFLFYTIIHPFIFSEKEEEKDLLQAKKWVNQYGRSSADYFKTYPDKLIFSVEGFEGFIAYKVAHDFAITLGAPVCANEPEIISSLLKSFEKFCSEHGLRTAYYRIDEEMLPHFPEQQKHSLLIGQEAIVNTTHFSMEGKKRQNLRTSRNTLQKKGYAMQWYLPPITDDILTQLRQVSDDWLSQGKEELVFSQGMFLGEEIKQQKILTLKNPGGVIVAFLNLVSDYRPSEIRYDLIRKVTNEHNGCMDWLMVELIRYCQENDINYLNMGLAPMSGIEAPKGLRERSMKFAYEKIKRFRHYKGLRNFKEKFDPVWENKYMIYNHHFDLVLLPAALDKVMKDFSNE